MRESDANDLVKVGEGGGVRDVRLIEMCYGLDRRRYEKRLRIIIIFLLETSGL